MRFHFPIKIFLLILVLSISVGQVLFAQNTSEMYNENLIPFQNAQHKWGYLDAQSGEVKIAPKYDQVSLFINGIAEVSDSNPKAKSQFDDEGLIGWIDTLGKEIFAPQFVDASPINKLSTNGLITSLTQVTTIDNKMGIISWPEADWVLKPGNYKDFYCYNKNYFLIDRHIIYYKGKEYEAPKGYSINVSDEENQLLYIQKKDELHKGLCTWGGKMIVAPQYLDIQYLPKAKRVLATKLNGILSPKNVLKFVQQAANEKKNDLTIYLMNSNGKVLAQFPSKYQPDIINQNTASYQTGDETMHYFSLHDGKMKDAPVPKPKFDYTIYKEGEYQGVKDKNGKELVPAIFLKLTELSSNLLIALNPSNYKYGIIDIDGKQIVPFIYGSLEYRSKNRLLAEKNSRYGMIDKQGNTIINFKYLLSFWFDSTGRADVNENDKEGVIDKNGKEIIPTIYQSLFNTKALDKTKATYYTAQKEGKWGLLDSTGKIIVPTNYGSVYVRQEDFENGWVTIEDTTREHRGLYNIKTGVIIPTDYDIIKVYSDCIIVGKMAGIDYHYQLLSTTGESLTTGIYTKMEFNYGYLSCRKGKLYGVLSTKGKILVPFKYNYLWEKTPHLLMAQQGDDYFFINTNGKEFKAPLNSI